MTEINFNVNHFVKVKLTPYGEKVLQEKYSKLKIEFHAYEFHPPEKDKDGYSKWQMWALMNEFGEHLYNGCNLCFETDIIICVED